MDKDVGEHQKVTKEEIRQGLEALGLTKGDLVMVHSSFTAFGDIEGGPDTVIDALLETMGPEGTVVMPTYSTNRRYLKDGLEEIQPFDPEKAPVWTGVIPEIFRKRFGAVRSFHPTTSLTAIGSRAKELCQSLESLVEENGYVLLMGVGLKVNSAMHIAEEIVRPPQFLQRLHQVRPVGLRGRIQSGIATLLRHMEGFIPQIRRVRLYGRALKDRWFCGRTVTVARPARAMWADFEKMEPIYRDAGVMKIVRIGACECRLIKTQPMIALFVEALRKNPDQFYTYRPSTYDNFVENRK